MKPTDLGLPYESWYPNQLESARAIAESEKKFTLLEGPCGTGKSLLAMAAAKLLDVSRTAILCSTKALQEQYAEDFGDKVTILFGRNNFQCALDEDFTCSEAPCTIDRGCSQEEKYSICPYYRRKQEAFGAAIVVTNTSYFLHEANYVGKFGNLDFLVIDEGDLLERDLLRFAGVELSRRSFQLSEVDLPHLRDAWEARRWAKEVLPKVERLRTREERLAEEDMAFLKNVVRLKGQCKRLRKLTFLDPEKWVLQENLYGYEVQPLWAADFGPEFVFKHAERVLIMSATMPPPDVYARQLGIEEEVQYLETPSFFPKEHRPVNFWPVAKLKGANLTDYQLRKITNAIDLILEAFPGQKGLIHTVSYKLRNAILSRTRYRRRFISHNLPHDKMGREKALEKFFRAEEPRVLISPSMGRGTDAAGDRARFVIQVKFPFLSLGNKQVKTRMEQDPDWYSAVTADELVQGFGRAVRSREDYAVGFLLDNQEWFFRRNKSLFPDWWRESVHKIEDIERAVLPPQMERRP